MSAGRALEQVSNGRPRWMAVAAPLVTAAQNRTRRIDRLIPQVPRNPLMMAASSVTMESLMAATPVREARDHNDSAGGLCRQVGSASGGCGGRR